MTMTNQEAFDKVCRHLMKQGKKSKVRILVDDWAAGCKKEDDVCAYRGPDGLMCAAGCLIPDFEYKPEFENQTIDQLVRKGLVPSLAGTSNDLLYALQGVHDYTAVENWPAELRRVARNYALSTAVLDEKGI